MDISPLPKLRALETQWIEHAGKPALLLQDRLALGARAVVVPEALAPLLALCDGTRDPTGIQTALELWTGLWLELSLVERVIAQLNDALLLDNGRYAAAYERARTDFREAPFRPAALAGGGYPEDRAELAAMLDGWLAESTDGAQTSSTSMRGLICPHIDYERGGPVYGRVWSRARESIDGADLFLIIGTDHAGGAGEITLTRQSYQTPFGILRTDADAVNEVAEAMGPEEAYRSELNHRGEHSIELAAVWLHHLVGNRDVRIVPVLCGSFHPFTHGEAHPREVERWQAAARALRELASREGARVIVAADLDHVGPAFGDSEPVTATEKASISALDTEMLATISRGDPDDFLSLLAGRQDDTHVCGLPPIYLALELLGDARGEVVSYAQCPAPNDSLVAVAGMLLR